MCSYHGNPDEPLAAFSTSYVHFDALATFYTICTSKFNLGSVSVITKLRPKLLFDDLYLRSISLLLLWEVFFPPSPLTVLGAPRKGRGVCRGGGGRRKRASRKATCNFLVARLMLGVRRRASRAQARDAWLLPAVIYAEGSPESGFVRTWQPGSDNERWTGT